MKKYSAAILMFILFESIAIILWQVLKNPFYLFNFSYIGCSLTLGLVLYAKKFKYARHIVQFLVGTYMLIDLGVLSHENMQIEGFWYYLFLGVFEAATIHYAVAKIFGPLLFGRGWCGYACWTAMILDLLPYKENRLYPLHHFCRFLTFCNSFICRQHKRKGKNHVDQLFIGQRTLLHNRHSYGLCIER